MNINFLEICKKLGDLGFKLNPNKVYYFEYKKLIILHGYKNFDIWIYIKPYQIRRVKQNVSFEETYEYVKNKIREMKLKELLNQK